MSLVFKKHPRKCGKFFISFLMILIFSSVSKSWSAASPAATNSNFAATKSLDQKAIHNAYNDGDFDKVISLIESYTKVNKTLSHSDSIFISKHLAVVYSANPKTREKGRYYMYRMLELMPTAELVDMFVSDEIDRIFEKVRREFLTRQKGFGVDSSQITTPQRPNKGQELQTAQASTNNNGASSAPDAASTSTTTPVSPASKSTPTKSGEASLFSNNTFWIAAGAGVAIAGATAVFILLSEDAPAGKTISIPSKTTAAN